MLLKSRAELTSGCQIPLSVPVAFAVGRQHSRVAFEFPSTLTILSELPEQQPHTENILAPGSAHRKGG